MWLRNLPGTATDRPKLWRKNSRAEEKILRLWIPKTLFELIKCPPLRFLTFFPYFFWFSFNQFNLEKIFRRDRWTPTSNLKGARGVCKCMYVCVMHKFQTSSLSKPLPDIIRHIEQSTVCALPFASEAYYFKICAGMNQSLIPPFTGAEIVKAR